MQSKTTRSETLYINRIVGIILATGMYLTIALYSAGVILALVEEKSVPAMSTQYFTTVGSFFYALIHFDARTFLYLGTLTLILTPVSRVFISIIAFWRQHDFKYVGVTVVVFLVIIASVIVGSVFKINVG